MSDWPKVRWTQARQITELMEVPRAAMPGAEITPQSWLDARVEQGDLAGAITFLGHALPRYEAVAWAAEIVAPKDRKSPVAASIARWLDGAEDADRRTVWSLTQEAEDDSPERLLAYAVFFSGGSIAPEDQAPVNPEPALCGRFASAAIIKSAYRTENPEESLSAALERGRGIAQGKAE